MNTLKISDIPAALGLLSRLPVKVNTKTATARGAKAAWAYPIAGLVIGTIAACIAWLGSTIGLSAAIVAGLTLATSAFITGAMHEDGLADSIDGLWGGWEPARRLEIMKDSRTGVYGVLALIFGTGLRWAALTALLSTDFYFAAIIATAVFSRAAMVCVMAGLPNARAGGLSKSVGRPAPQTAWIGVAAAMTICIVLIGLNTATIVIVALILTSICAGIAKQKIGGQTGDILGATQQVNEIGLLIALTAAL